VNKITFSNLFEKNFLALANSTDTFSTIDVILNLFVTFILGMFIFYVYKKTFQGVLYQKSFNISLVLVSMVTALIIQTISGNLILSLGMVGALSIVRFRTPIKDTIDMVFLFWAISIGISNGVKYYNVSIVGSILISLAILFLTRNDNLPEDNPYLLIAELDNNSTENELYEVLDKSVKKYKLKNKSITNDFIELSIEIKLKNSKTDFLSTLINNKKIKKATLIAFSGDIISA